MFNFVIILASLEFIVFITLALIAHLSDTAAEMWYEAECFCEGYDALISTGKKVFERDNMRWNRFLHQKGCLCSPQDHASLKAAFRNEKQAA